MTDLEKNAGAGGGPDVYLTVDVEPDCPPYLWTWRGIVEGMPALMEVLDREQVPVTFFTTGATAQAHPPACLGVAHADAPGGETNSRVPGPYQYKAGGKRAEQTSAEQSGTCVRSRKSSK